jgi:hypothetical protein
MKSSHRFKFQLEKQGFSKLFPILFGSISQKHRWPKSARRSVSVLRPSPRTVHLDAKRTHEVGQARGALVAMSCPSAFIFQPTNADRKTCSGALGVK